MAAPTAMLFVDGENLLFRYQEMLRAGRKPMPEVSHVPDALVWTGNVTRYRDFDLLRVSYYTSHVGTDETQRVLEENITRLGFTCERTRSLGTLNPHVFRKRAREKKSRSVDINIAIDVLRHCYQKDVQAVFIISGDGDYIPLIKEAMRTGTRVFVGALSSGLNPALRTAGDMFMSLDDHFFQPPEPV